MSTVLITGGAGFIGSHLVRSRLERGDKVRVLDDLSSGYMHNIEEVASDIEFFNGSICDRDLLAKAMPGVDYVFHLAARASVPRSVAQPVEAHEVNVNGTLNVLLAARDAGAKRVINSASSSAYGETPELPKRENMLPSPLSPYAVGKLAAEHYCQCFSHVYDLQTVSLRYFNVFGPRQDPNGAYAAVIPAFVSRMLQGSGPVVYGNGEQSRDFCFVENVVSANNLASEAEKTAGEAVNIACGERTSLNDMIVEINRLLGTDHQADYQPPRAGDVMHSLAALEEAKRVLKYEPKILFAEGLQRSINWYRENL